jgi:iron-sulfur cluster assembly protein
MEEVKKPIITASDKAIVALKQELATRKAPNKIVRLGVRGIGCSGFTFIIEYGISAKENDTAFSLDDGLGVVIDPKSLALLDGLHLDREESLMRQEFSFTAPRIKSHCGCKKSFSIA